MSSSPAEIFDSAQYFAFHNPQSHSTIYDGGYIFRPSSSSIQDNFTNQNSREEQTQDGEPTSYSFTTLPNEINPNSKYISEITHKLKIKSPEEWSTERPYVYTLVIVLKNAADGKIVQAESCRVAIRTVDIHEGLLRVNTKPIMIRGTNILEYDSTYGCSIPRSLCELDIQLMKRNNINAIKTPPHDPWFYELCSLYGIYVINEVNIQPHFENLSLSDDPDWESAYLTRLIRLYGRDKIYPSIIIWSLGNRSGYGKIHDKMAIWIRATDPTRLVMYEPASYGPRPTSNVSIQNRIMATDILCPMYSQVSDLISLANRFPDHPLILSEYSLMTGNSGGNIEEYWNSFNTYRRLQGGFLSNWTDQNFIHHSILSKSWNWDISESNINDIKILNSRFFSGLNWHYRGQIKEEFFNDNNNNNGQNNQNGNNNNIISYGLNAQLPHSGFAKERELQEMGRILVKPQLLEIKQCMKLFDCEIIETKFSEEINNNPTLLISIKLKISNLTYHLDNLTDLLNFEIFLLCNGALVAVSPFLIDNNEDIDLSDHIIEKESFQKILGFSQFTIPFHKDHDDFKIHGIIWPEDLLSIPISFQSLTKQLNSLIDPNILIKIDPKLTLCDWRIVILSRLATHMSWGSAGLPLGFKQLKLGKNDELSLTNLSLQDEIQKQKEKLSKNDKKYQFNIKWISSSSTSSSSNSNSNCEPNILLCAESIENTSPKIEVVISSQTGYLSSFKVSDKEILKQIDNNENFQPSRFQLHRAATSIDQKGYSCAWKVSGLDKEMHHISSSECDETPIIGTDIIGHTNLKLIQVDRIYLHQRDDLQVSSSSELKCYGEGVMCTWEMSPDIIDRGKILLLDKIHKFVNDTSTQTLLVEIRSNGQENFLFQLAAVFKLGKEVILTKEEELEQQLAQEWNISDNSNNINLKDFIKYRLWKMRSLPSSSIPYIEAHSSIPTNSLKYDEIDSIDDFYIESQKYYDHSINNNSNNNNNNNNNSEDNEHKNEKNQQNNKKNIIDFNCRKHFSVKWKVSYILDTDGNLLIRGGVDISTLPCPPARIGIQLNLNNDFDKCKWLGNGPHENYLDRKASTVFAIHSAPCSTLFVPYSIPGENGGRSHTQWIEFNSSTSSSTSSPFGIKIRCNPLCTFSAQKYSTEDLMRSLDINDLNLCENDYLSVNIDPYMLGIGSDDSWSISISDQYLIPPKIYNFQFVLSAAI